MSDKAAGWEPDPTGKHDHRYWDGTQWTDNVADAGVAATDPYEASAPEPPPLDAPAADPSGDEPTVVTPVEPVDTTASYPTAAAQPAPPPPYVPPTPVADGGSGGDGRKRGLLIGGAILAAVAVAVIAFLLLGDDDESNEPVADRSDTTTTEEDGDDPEALGDLRDACADGDLSACDELYFSADLGSELETFGSTCGGTADPQEGSCELTNGGEDELGTDGSGDGFTDGLSEDTLAEIYAEAFGISEEQAGCLAGKLSDAVEDGDLTEDEAMTEIFDYLEDCDISLEEIGAN